MLGALFNIDRVGHKLKTDREPASKIWPNLEEKKRFWVTVWTLQKISQPNVWRWEPRLVRTPYGLPWVQEKNPT